MKKYRLRVFLLTISRLFCKTYTANICKHRTKKTGEIVYDDGSCTLSMPLSENGNPDYCLDCITKMSIKCAWCENSIHIGDPVTLYIPQESFKIPEHAVRYDKDERCLVGCLGWDCAQTGADRQGFWMPPGKVTRVPSLIEMLMSSENQGKAVIIRNLSNPSDLGKVI